jgi:hypothetical protein
MKKVGLKFLLEYGMFFSTTMLEQDAFNLIKDWTYEDYKQRKQTHYIGNLDGNTNGPEYSIDISRIVALHTFDPSPVPQPTPQPVTPPINGSGFPGIINSGHIFPVWRS